MAIKLLVKKLSPLGCAPFQHFTDLGCKYMFFVLIKQLFVEIQPPSPEYTTSSGYGTVLRGLGGGSGGV